MADISTKQHAFLASGFKRGQIGAYTRGSRTIDFIRRHAFLYGALDGDTSVSAYTSGAIFVDTSQHAYITSLQVTAEDRIFAYCYGIIRDRISAYTIGEGMAQVDFVWLKTSDGGVSLSKKFRVLQQDYDDGTLEKAEDVKKTIGGGVDHSVGAVYKTWSMIIKVRHTETQADYGDLADLEYLYGLNNPGGTPSNDITFIDHHQSEYTVHTVGKLTKNLLGCQVEGECAWYLYKLQLLRVQ